MNSIPSLEVFWNKRLVGKLAMSPDQRCAFQYDPEFIRSGTSISPFFLPLDGKVFLADHEPFGGMFGVFADSLSDSWGNLLLDRYWREQGRDPNKLTILERLALIGSRGRGALEYSPNRSMAYIAEVENFERIASKAEQLLENKCDASTDHSDLYKYGYTSGGSRPKIFTKIDGEEWLVKFRGKNDPANIGKIEYSYAVLAQECGIDMPKIRLMEDKYFAIKRFDRTSEGKVHTISAAGLLNASHSVPSLDYVDLLNVCRILTADMGQVYQLFRRAVFNAVISNRDDHAKNFSFQHRSGRWQLSPAYDMLPSSGFNSFHTTTFNGKGEPEIEDIMLIAKQVGLNKRRAREIVEEITEKCEMLNMDIYSLILPI